MFKDLQQELRFVTYIFEFNNLSAVESASLSSNVRLSPVVRKLSANVQGLGNRVAFAKRE